jgi:hypothetical protein
MGPVNGIQRSTDLLARRLNPNNRTHTTDAKNTTDKTTPTNHTTPNLWINRQLWITQQQQSVNVRNSQSCGLRCPPHTADC